MENTNDQSDFNLRVLYKTDEIIESVERKNGNTYISKRSKSYFFTTDLARILT